MCHPLRAGPVVVPAASVVDLLAAEEPDAVVELAGDRCTVGDLRAMALRGEAVAVYVAPLPEAHAVRFAAGSGRFVHAVFAGASDER